MTVETDRKKIIDRMLMSWGAWARSERGVNGYPKKATLYNVIYYGTGGAAAIRDAASDREDDHPIEESIEEAIVYMADISEFVIVVKCLKARYLGLIKGKYYTELPDSEAATYLGMPRQSYYREIDRGLRFIDGWLSAKKM